MALIQVSDEQIKAFKQLPERAHDLCNRVIPSHATNFRRLYLDVAWRGLTDILGRISVSLPAAFLERGDVHYQGGSDPTWLLTSATARAVAELLFVLSGDAGAPHFAARRDREAEEFRRAQAAGAVAFQSCDVDKLADTRIRELRETLVAVRDYVSDASRLDLGILVCRYEDW